MTEDEERKQWLVKYNEEHEDLLKQWDNLSKKNNHYPSDEENPLRNVFISDGIAYPEIWFKNEIRPLFVLKEAYDSSGNKEPWNEVKEFIVEAKHEPIKGTSKTWKKLCLWSHNIFEAPIEQVVYWDDKYLKQIAVINIKKYGGRNPSENNDLEWHAGEYAKKIYQQIALIKPTVIICGYTGWLLDIVWKETGKGEKIRTSPKGRLHLVKTEDINAVLIDFWHPSCTKNHSIEWQEDMEAFHRYLSEHALIGQDPVPVEPPYPGDSENEKKM